MKFGWRTAAKIAWRESRPSALKFMFVILAVAAGVGALTGVRGFSRAFHNMLMREARTLLAADIAVRMFALPDAAQNAAMDALSRRGVVRTWITETISMAGTGGGKPPLLVSVKAVDPARYPFYGKLRLDPEADPKTALTADTVAVSDDFLLRSGKRPGDDVSIGGQDYRIVGVLRGEPDRMAGSLNVGPRLMMTRQGLDRARLIQVGSRASERFLFKIPPGVKLASVSADLKKAFPESMVADATETHPIISRGLNEATTFLSLVSLISLIVGALGVATAMSAHLQQRLDTIAVMKCLGARSSQLMRIYLLQTAGLGLSGGVLGIIFGLAVQRVFPILIARYFPQAPGISLDIVPAAQGLGIGLLTTLLFTVPTLLSVRRIRPILIFRREMAESKPSWRERIFGRKDSILAGAALVLGLGAIAGSLTTGTWRDAARLGSYFVGALLVSLLALGGIAWLLLRGLRLLLRRAPWRWPVAARHGMANLYRPGNHAQAALVAMGIGVMFTLTVYLIQNGVLAEMNKTAPPGMPNVFLLDISSKEAPAVMELLKQQKGLERAPELMGTVAAKIVRLNGTEIEKLGLRGFARRFHFTRQVSAVPEKPPYAEVLQGAFWKQKPTEPEICTSEDAAKTLKLKVGDRIEWRIAGRAVATRIACVTRIDPVHLSGRLEFLFSPGALEQAPVIFYGSVRVRPQDVGSMQVAVYQKFPTITVVNLADVLAIVQEVVQQISVVVRFISAFAILAGAIILASSVAGTRWRRIREVVTLKTLGATRQKIASIFSVEFLILGLVAGVMGSILATAFSALVLKRLLKADVPWVWWPHVLSIGVTALIANAAGWMASFRILGQKPLEILREE
jgi:putative ABC transport system permease protein